MELNLIEELMLLAISDYRGKFVPDSIRLQYGISGAVLLELSLIKKITPEDRNIQIQDTSPTNDKLLNDCLKIFENREKTLSIKEALEIVKLQSAKIKVNTIQSLIDKKILEKKRNKILWVIPNVKYLPQDPEPENQIRERMNALINDKSKGSLRELALLSLIDISDLINEVFENAPVNEIRKKIKKIFDEKQVENTLKQLLDEINSTLAILSTTNFTTATVSTYDS